MQADVLVVHNQSIGCHVTSNSLVEESFEIFNQEWTVLMCPSSLLESDSMYKGQGVFQLSFVWYDRYGFRWFHSIRMLKEKEGVPIPMGLSN